MEYNIFFDICSVCISIVIIMTFYYKRSKPSFKTRVFECLVLANAGAAVFDIISIFANVSGCSMTLKWLINMAYYVIHCATSFLGVSYFVVMAEPIVKMSTKRKLQLIIPYAIQVILIAFNPILKLLFYFDENGVYCRGSLLWLIYAIAVYYIIYMMIFVVRHTDFFDYGMRFVIICFSLMFVVPMIVQIIHPEFLIECFAATLFIMTTYILYQRDDNSIDSSTGLLSYQAFESDCKAYIATDLNFSALMIKLRDSKFISDTFGNQMCAKIYSAFAKYIGQYVRFGNAYSLGGGVFALCFINESIDPKNVIENLSARMKEPWGFEEMTTKLSVSMSLISYPIHAADFPSYMELVDSVFYRCESKPQLIYADSIIVKDRRRRSDIERALSSESVNEKLEIFYQPIYSRNEKRFTSIEALVRLRDKTLGYVMPDEFILTAEKSGAMVRIGEYIFESVCKFISESEFDKLGIKYVTINLSVIQCMQTDLVSVIGSIMQKYGVNPSSICFEISELSSIDPPDVMINNIKELRRLGVSFALDNYGTGNSGLNQLTLIPLRFIKFDSSFIRRAFNSEIGRTMLQSSINVSKSINLSVIAEGIENEQMAQLIEGYDFDYCQGYHYSSVCKAEEVAHKIKELNAAAGQPEQKN